MTTKVFTRLDIAFQSAKWHPFILKQLAYYQWNNKQPFTSGPCICADPAPDEYSYWGIAGQIHESMRYYMKPHELLVFGNDVRNTNKSHILSRVWLNSTNDKNRALVLLERANIVDNDYWRQINTRSWQPTNWNSLQRANELHQTIGAESQGCKWRQCRHYATLNPPPALQFVIH